MATEPDLQQAVSSEIERALRQAQALHQTGQFQLAEQLYTAILQLDPNHPDANHNLGVLAVQKNQPAAALSYFLSALNADPARGKFWISYIDALILSEQSEEARQILKLARQQGLAGDEVDALVLRLDSNAQNAESAVTDIIAQGIPKKRPNPVVQKRKTTPDNQKIKEITTLFSKGRYAEALISAQKMTVHFPLYGYGWKALGAVLKQMGRNTEALSAMQKAAELSPDDIEALGNLAKILQDMGYLEQAAASYRRVLHINPDNSDVHCNLGVTLKQLGRLDEAESCFRQALQIKPSFAQAHNNLGNLLKDKGLPDHAEACYRQALQHMPGYAEAHNNLGVSLKALGRFSEAETEFRRALTLKPLYIEALNNLGNLLRELGKAEEALAYCQRALQINPAFADAHCNLSGIQKELGQLDESIASARQAIALIPDSALSYNNLGNALQTRGDSEAAIACYRQALTLAPDDVMARYNLGFAQLSCGQLTEGWANYESRTCIDRKRFPYPAYWTGENLNGKSILLWGEQGIGDEIIFASQYNELIAQADRCVIECSPKLVSIFTRSFPKAQVIPKTEPPHPATRQGFDYQCAAGSLAQWLRPNLTSFPQQNNFLRPDPERIAYWKIRLAKIGPGAKIGFCWRSSLRSGERHLHYTTLDQWGPIFNVPGVHFINLQYDKCSTELDEASKQFGITLHAFPEVDMYNDLDETAALIAALDMVVSAPTAVSTISAALDMPVWVMNYGISWETHGTDHNPWFPSLHYFNKQWNQAWDEIIKNIVVQLQSRKWE